jgi:hypothetical protein
MKFGKYEPESMNSVYDGIRYVFKFDNGYGASVVSHYGSMGHRENLYEMAILKNDKITYETDFTTGVIGMLTVADVESFLDKIKAY